MRQSGRRSSRRSADDKIRYIRMAAIPLIIVIVLVIIIVVMDRKTGGPEAGATSDSLTTLLETAVSQESGESVEPDNNQYTTDFSQYELQKDAVPQVNLLISDYFQAKVDQDAEKLFVLLERVRKTKVWRPEKKNFRMKLCILKIMKTLCAIQSPGLRKIPMWFM